MKLAKREAMYKSLVERMANHIGFKVCETIRRVRPNCSTKRLSRYLVDAKDRRIGKWYSPVHYCISNCSWKEVAQKLCKEWLSGGRNVFYALRDGLESAEEKDLIEIELAGFSDLLNEAKNWH